jgi:predicted esterase
VIRTRHGLRIPVHRLLALVVVLAAVLRTDPASADVVIRPGPQGGLGIWLVAGPLFGTEANLRFTPKTDAGTGGIQVAQGASVMPGRAFGLLQAPSGRFDLQKALRAQPNAFALFAGVLRASAPTRVLLILGTDDGVRVTVDDRVVLNKDLWRPALHDDDVVELDLSPGDHPLLIRLRQRSGEWKFAARLLDASDGGPPRSVQLILPGVAPDQVNLSMLTEVDVGLSTFADRYEPFVRVRAEGGLPAYIRLSVTAAAITNPDSPDEAPFFDVALGDLPASARRVHALEARLPAIPALRLLRGQEEVPIELRVRVGKQETRARRQGHPVVRRALGTLDDALRATRGVAAPSHDGGVVRATLELSRDRLADLVSSGDDDLSATVQEATASEAFARHVLDGGDAWRRVQGPMRLAYPSPLDGKNRPFGVYVPPSLAEGKTYPLVVVLHGLNGLPMQMVRIFFGQDHPWRRAPWEDRHVADLPSLDAFVVSPSGFGNISYREFGEADVMHVVEWMKRTYPIDEDRVYVTGLSMGGTGAAAIGLRYADQFAAAAPLCGYHSYALRNDMANRELRAWEKALASFWSNVSWAERGKHLPLYVVHGKKDEPVENSGVLIDRYHELGYPVFAEHPNVGHNVWQQTYEGFKAYRWLAQHKRNREPADVVLTTSSLRYADHAWVHVTELEQHLGWGRVHARVGDGRIEVQTDGVRAVTLDRPASRLSASTSVTVAIDGKDLVFPPGVPMAMRREGESWEAGARAEAGLRKRRALSGPIRDAFLEPLVFVVGTQEPGLTDANLHVARALASPPFGVEARWPVIADVDVDVSLASTHALFLVGSSQSNAYVARIADRLPLRMEGRQVVMGAHRIEGKELGMLFVYPNPLHPNRYVIVLAAPDAAGTLRALSLPRMLPDFVVYDERVAGARGQMVLGSASLLAGGMFDQGWGLPESWQDAVDAKRMK